MKNEPAFDSRERREFVRFDHRIQVKCVPQDGAGVPEHAQVRDLCAGGARLELVSGLQPKTRVELIIDEPGRAVHLVLSGTVAWSQWQANYRRFETGIAFLGLSPEHSESLMALVTEPPAREERRRYVRLQKHLVVDLKRRGSWFGGHLLATTINISCGGAALAVGEPLQTGVPYLLKIHLWGEQTPFRAEAVPEAAQHNPDASYTVRVRFTKVGDDDLHRLGRFLSAEFVRPPAS